MRQNVDNRHLRCRPRVTEHEVRRKDGMDRSIPVNLWKVDAIVDEKRNGSSSEGLGRASCEEQSVLCHWLRSEDIRNAVTLS